MREVIQGGKNVGKRFQVLVVHICLGPSFQRHPGLSSSVFLIHRHRTIHSESNSEYNFWILLALSYRRSNFTFCRSFSHFHTSLVSTTARVPTVITGLWYCFHLMRESIVFLSSAFALTNFLKRAMLHFNVVKFLNECDE